MIDYQCVKLGEEWHLTQEQATPPHILRGGCFTSCSVWADFKLGFERRRPTCPACCRHVDRDESSRLAQSIDSDTIPG